ncbi:enoyl-CoA hydratase/isomerase family protein [Christensenella sp.]|uniref:enoyl-CoA hydratase/isomerase family protein n=1 Tax=Christensenella sp. TaxID=1935934 RepID=UPI003FA4075D
MELTKIKYSVDAGIAIAQMDFKKNLNAIDEVMADELMAVVEAAEKDSDVKVLVLKGGEKAFSAGGDIGYFYDLIQGGGDVNMDGLIAKVGIVTDGLKRMSKLVIAQVSGSAAGAGVSLALSADFIVCSENAKFIMAFVNLGLVPDTGGSYLLVKELGEKQAMALCATGRPLSAQEAQDAGIVYQVVPGEELDGAVMKLAAKFAAGPSLSYKNIKKQIYEAAFLDYKHYLDECEIPTQRECAASRDFQEGVSAFMEKRKAAFTGA